jgi:hypothetical protein
VLPITIDDLTSGFNIAEIVTLKKNLHNMLGFTQGEVNDYVKEVFETYGFNTGEIPQIIGLLKNYYNGYTFIPEGGENLYNSTILTYFLKSFVIDKGEIPKDMIDTNLRTDLSWIKRLTEKMEQTLQLVETLMIHGSLPYDDNELKEKFNMTRFFEPGFYSSSLFYLGMLTRRDKFHMNFPNQTVNDHLQSRWLLPNQKDVKGKAFKSREDSYTWTTPKEGGFLLIANINLGKIIFFCIRKLTFP